MIIRLLTLIAFLAAYKNALIAIGPFYLLAFIIGSFFAFLTYTFLAFLFLSLTKKS